MKELVLILIGFLPAMAYAILLYRWLGNKEEIPISKYILCLMAGLVTAVPAYYLQRIVEPMIDPDYTSWGDAILVAFCSVSLIEEVIKVGMTYLLVRWLHPQGAVQLAIIAVAVSMGFAGVENALYVQDLGWEVALFRALTAIPAHLCFAIASVYFLGMNWPTDRPVRYLLQGFGFVVVMHGLYDTFIIQRASEEALLIALIVLALCILLAYRMHVQLLKKETSTPQIDTYD